MSGTAGSGHAGDGDRSARPIGSRLRDALLGASRRLLPATARRKISRLAVWPPRGAIRFGSLRRLTPISREWGFDRGTPVDRHYIGHFLSSRQGLIRGSVLEIGEKRYSLLGGDLVERFEILHVSEQRADVTKIGDLTDPSLFPEGTFDCIIATQTLQFIYDVRAAVEGCHRFLKPGGTLLVTIPGISQISRDDMDQWGHFWALTTKSSSRLFGEVFTGGRVEVVAYGNVLTSISFLHGVASEELDAQELDHHDPDYEMLLGIAATKRTVGV